MAVAFEQLATQAMFDYDLEISLVTKYSVRFKLNHKYNLELDLDGHIRLVEDYEPEPYVSTQKILDLYEKGFLYTLDRGVAIVELKEPKVLESDFKKYIQLVKKIKKQPPTVIWQ